MTQIGLKQFQVENQNDVLFYSHHQVVCDVVIPPSLVRGELVIELCLV